MKTENLDELVFLLQVENESLEQQLFQAKSMAWTFFLAFMGLMGYTLHLMYPNEVAMLLTTLEAYLTSWFE